MTDFFMPEKWYEQVDRRDGVQEPDRVANYIKNLFAVFRMPKGCAMMAEILTILHKQAKLKE
jgi:hypothetical protein